MIPVIIESPHAGEIERNKAYLQLCILDCFRRNEAGFASHQMYTDALDDLVLAQRNLGIEAGLVWGGFAERSVVYTDFGISSGMQCGILSAEKCGRPIEKRTLPFFNAKAFHTPTDAKQETPWIELFTRALSMRVEPKVAQPDLPFADARILLDEINELAGARRLYRNEAEHDAALLMLVARSLHLAKAGA